MSAYTRPAKVDPSRLRAAHDALLRRGDAPLHPFDPRTFDGGDYVIVAFKVLGDRKREHWLNKLAVWATQTWSDRCHRPAGRLCHCEIMVQPVKDIWYRFSVNKKTHIGYDERGKDLWLEGRVHGKLVKAGTMKKYAYFCVPLPRNQQFWMWSFFATQLNNPFNFRGYATNILLPSHWGFGFRGFRAPPTPEERRDAIETKRRWFCAELCLAAMQVGGIAAALGAAPRKASPNSIYRVCLSMSNTKGVVNPIDTASISI